MRELTLDRLPRKVLARLDLETAFIASRCVIAAERLLLFRKLNGRALTVKALGKRAGINDPQLGSLLELLVFLGLLTKHGGKYTNSHLARKHFIEERSIDWTGFWPIECARDYDALSALDEVLASGRDWRKILGKERKADYEMAREDPEWARGFTRALYDNYRSDAELLAANLDLSGFDRLLDVGGGSGVMSIALARKHPRLKACVLDFKYVCDAATDIIRKERMSRRVSTLAGDMYGSIPRGYDVIMFWNIGTIHTRVMEMAYKSMPVGGMIIRSCPAPSRAKVMSPRRFLNEYVGVRPRSQSRDSIKESLIAAGFRNVKYRAIKKQLHLLVGRK